MTESWLPSLKTATPRKDSKSPPSSRGAHAKDLAPHGATAVAITPGWLRSEMMLEAYGVIEATWWDATAKQPHFAISETPPYVGRAVAALAADPDRARWNGQSLSSGELAQV